MSLADKLRKAREQRVEVGGFAFTVRRPTDLQMLGLRERLAAQDVSALIPFVVGWDGVKEIDIIPGGNPVAATFDAETCAEWLADRPDLLNPLAVEVIDAYRAHAQALEDAKKN